MGWQLSLALKGDLQRFFDAELKAGKQAVTSVIRRRTTGLKNNLRRQVARAGLSKRLGNTIQAEVYPKRGNSLGAAGVVRSKARYKRPGGITDLITVLDEGTTIHASAGKALSIPLPAAGRGRGVKKSPFAKTPSDFPAGTFRFVPGKKSVGVLVFKSGSKKGQAAFILVRQVSLRKKIDIDKAYNKAIRGIDDAVAKAWERNDRKAQNRFDVNI